MFVSLSHDNLLNPGKHVSDSVSGSIEFRDVCFSYPTRPDLQVLKVGNCIKKVVFGMARLQNNQSFPWARKMSSTLLRPTLLKSDYSQNMSFTVQPGEMVALVGPSGGGKSSCISLMQHYYRPTTGSVLIDGKPVHEFEHHYYHRIVSLFGLQHKG